MRDTTPIRVAGLFALVAMLLPAYLAYAATSGPSPIPPPPNFQIGTSALVICKGLTNIVPITITNLGGASNPNMTDVQVNVNSRSFLDVGNTIQILNIPWNSSYTVNVPVFVGINATTSLIIAQVPITYTFDIDYADSEVRNVSIGIATCPQPLMMNVSPNVLIPGIINNVTLNFTNTGGTTLNYINAKTSVSNGQGGIQFLQTSPIVINQLPPGETVSVTRQIYENSSAQTFPLNLTVSFFNGTSPEEISQSFAMISSGLIDLVPSSITVSPTNVVAGGIFSISFIVTDTGTAGATEASAQAITPKGFRAYGANSTFIGSIPTDSQTPITLDLITNTSIKSGTYTIPVRISYINSLRQNESSTVNVTVVVGGGGALSGLTYNSTSGARYYAERKSGSGIAWIVVVVILVAIAGSSLYMWKKGKLGRVEKMIAKIRGSRKNK